MIIIRYILALSIILCGCDLVYHPFKNEDAHLNHVSKKTEKANLLVFENNINIIAANGFPRFPSHQPLRQLTLNSSDLDKLKTILRSPNLEAGSIFYFGPMQYTHKIEFIDSNGSILDSCYVCDRGIEFENLYIDHNHSRLLHDNLWKLIKMK